MGASAVPEGTTADAFLFGALPEAIAARRSRPSSSSRRASGSAARPSRSWPGGPSRSPPPIARPRSRAPIPARVERWFGESNFHHGEFRDLRRLVALKEQQGLTVSLVLPTLNEEETIGPIVRRARRVLVEGVPLVDELLVIDSASTDRTREIAEAEGARVVQHPDVLPRYGCYRGKGEALWKSLYETSGDLVVWCDTDVRNWHPRMVYGTLGPLLTEPRIQYVKGYYQRPIVEGGVLKEGGGGRVTELVARPLINLFFPELSGFIQPLAGEYAGRRTLLESIPFFTGYAVEIGHLIDIAERVGLDGARPGRPGAAGPPQPGARGPVADELRHPPGGHEAAGGAAPGAPVRGARLDDEAAALRRRPPRPRDHRAGRPRAAADDPHPGVPRAAPASGRRRWRTAAASRPRGEPGGRPRTPARRPTPLTVLIAPDSFKGSLTSVEVARALADGWRRARPATTIRLAPLADGGEGTLVAIEAAGGWEWRTARGPRSARPRDRGALAGLRRRHPGRRGAGRGVRALAPRPGRSATRSRLHLRDRARSCGPSSTPGIRRIDLGVGGSATTDGGLGILAALGLGMTVDPELAVHLDDLDPRLAEVDLRIASDVTNPLLGPAGAAAVYGPQKGASRWTSRNLDAALGRWADVLEAATGRRERDTPGAGAAGGTVFGLACLRDRFRSFAIVPGVDLVMEATGFAEKLAGADLVLTGEGRIDAQTAFGKTALGRRPAGGGGRRAVHRRRRRRGAGGDRGAGGGRRGRRPGRRAPAVRRGGDGRRPGAARALRRAAGAAGRRWGWGCGGRGGRGDAGHGTATRIVIHDDFDDPLPEFEEYT